MPWEDALAVCKQHSMTLLKYINEESLLQLYRSAKKNAEMSGWHGLGDVVYLGGRLKVSISPPLILATTLKLSTQSLLQYVGTLGCPLTC